MFSIPFRSSAALIALGIAFTPAICQAVTWTAPAALNSNFATENRLDDDPAIATDGNNNWVSHWGSNQPPGLEYDGFAARSADNGVTWTAPITVNSDGAGDTGQDICPELATDGNGTWLAVWTKNGGPGAGVDADAFYARSLNNGATWSTLAPLNSYATTDTSTIHEEFPHVATDKNGNWVAVWQSTDFRGPGTGRFLFSATSTNNGATWGAAKLVCNDALSTGPQQTIPYIATDGSGTWVALASATSATSSTTGFDKDILSFRSTDNGATWTAPLPVNSNATTDSISDEYPHIACDGRSTWVATWASASFFSPGEQDIAASRSTDGGLTWSPMVAVHADAATDTRGENEPQSVSDGHGSWIVGWRASNGDNDIWYAQSRDNGKTWTNAGPLNTNASTDSGADGRVSFASDKRGKWIANWNSTSTLPGGAGPDQEIHFASTVYTNPELALSPGSLNFGVVHKDAGSTGPLSFIVTNTGLAALNFTGLGLEITGSHASDFSILSPDTTALAAGTSRTIQLSYNPVAVGTQSAQLLITTDDGASPSLSLPLSGSATDQAIAFYATNIHCGNQLVSAGPNPPQPVTIQNVGSVGNITFTGSGFAISGAHASDFQIVGSPVLAPLAPGDSRSFDISFDPSATGVRNAILSVTSDEPNSPRSATLVGHGTTTPADAENWQLFE